MPKKNNSKEFEFLNIIQNVLSSKYIGDDCAYLNEYKLALSCDTLVEDVHFSCSYMTPYEIARKALLVNISDILASGANPKYVLINLSGKLDSCFIEEFYKGVKNTADEFELQVIGGDLTKSQKIVVSITILGDYKNSTPSSRKNAKEGYIIAAAGEFGSSAKGLLELQEGKKEGYFVEYHKNPPLYKEVSSLISKTVTCPYAMMDASDGLFDCLYQISKKSNVLLEVDYSKVLKKVDNKDFVLYGGEDYALVVCLDNKDFEKISSKAPELIKIGVCKSGEGVIIDSEKPEYKGFKHFE